MTKFDFQALKVRRAFSMNGKTTADDGEWSVEDLNSGGEDLNSNRTRDYQDDVKCYMRDRRFSWPLL